MERRLWRLVDADLFRFTTTDLQDVHLTIMMAFEQAAVLAPALGVDQIRSAMDPGRPPERHAGSDLAVALTLPNANKRKATPAAD